MVLHSATGVHQVETFTIAPCKGEKPVRFSTNRFSLGGVASDVLTVFQFSAGRFRQLSPLSGVAVPARQPTLAGKRFQPRLTGGTVR